MNNKAIIFSLIIGLTLFSVMSIIAIQGTNTLKENRIDPLNYINDLVDYFFNHRIIVIVNNRS